MDWKTGRLLDTPTTRRWTPEEKERGDQRERRGIYENFTAEDNGRSRRTVAVCETPSQAQEIISRIASLEAEIEVERGRAEKATARCVELFDQFSAAVARAEKARWWKCPVCTEETETADVLAELRCPCCGHTSAPVLAAARSDAVREFAEWLRDDGHRWGMIERHPKCGGDTGMACTGSSESPTDAAARYLARKEPTE